MALIEVDGTEVETEPEQVEAKKPIPLGGRNRARRFGPPPDGLTVRQDIEQQAKTTLEAAWEYITRETKDTIADEILDEGDRW